MVGRYPLAGSILPCGSSPLYHEYRGSTLNQPEFFPLHLLTHKLLLWIQASRYHHKRFIPQKTLQILKNGPADAEILFDKV
jgi:hypothetical protein